jgi:hypothetical protein
MNAVSSKYCSLSLPTGCMTFPFPTKPYYLLGERAGNIQRPQEMSAVSSKYCSLSLPIGCMTFLFPTKPYYLLGERAENINEANGNECSQFKSTAA